MGGRDETADDDRKQQGERFDWHVLSAIAFGLIESRACGLMGVRFHSKIVSPSTRDHPWITDLPLRFGLAVEFNVKSNRPLGLDRVNNFGSNNPDMLRVQEKRPVDGRCDDISEMSGQNPNLCPHTRFCRVG